MKKEYFYSQNNNSMSRAFQFKKFTIQQQCNAMKVSTDACVFGSVVADFLASQKNISHSADIGAGTGLLSCMIQQKNTHLFMDAIEIEPAFCEEMKGNMATCVFENHMTIINQPLQRYIPSQKYDVLFSNPPFFINHMVSANEQRRQVRHSILLTPEDIFEFTKNYLHRQGYLCLLLPYADVDIWQKKSVNIGLFLYRKINIKTRTNKPYARAILIFSFVYNTPMIEEELVYTHEDNQYTDSFKMLLQEYYLNL